MKDTSGFTLKVSDHSIKVMADKGFDPETVKETFNNPTQVYPSRSHPGQYRITGNGLCLVGRPTGNIFTLITLYADRVLTPPRPDQLDTPEGRRYAERYEKGLGRG
jgi:hypothetical protein